MSGPHRENRFAGRLIHLLPEEVRVLLVMIGHESRPVPSTVGRSMIVGGVEPVGAAEAATAEPGVATEGPVSGEISPEMEPQVGEQQLQPETEAAPAQPLPDWLTFPEAEAPVQEIPSTETTQFEEATEAVPT